MKENEKIKENKRKCKKMTVNERKKEFGHPDPKRPRRDFGQY